MLEAIKNLPREYRNRVKANEVIDRLSFNIWKTRNRILEEVVAARIEKGEEPLSIDEAFFYSPQISTSRILTRLLIQDIVEMKHENELTKTETAWASKSDSDADERESQSRRDHNHAEICFYRFTGKARKRKPKENKLPAGALDPVVITNHPPYVMPAGAQYNQET